MKRFPPMTGSGQGKQGLRAPSRTAFGEEPWQVVPLDSFLGHMQQRGTARVAQSAPPARAAQPAGGIQRVTMDELGARRGETGPLPNLERYFPGGFGRHPCVGIYAGRYSRKRQDLSEKKLELMIYYRKHELPFCCHSCGAPIEMNADFMPWSADHQPPNDAVARGGLLLRVLRDPRFEALGLQVVEDRSGEFQTIAPVHPNLWADFDSGAAHAWPARNGSEIRQYLYPQCPYCSHRQG